MLKFSKYSGNGNDFIILDHPFIPVSAELVQKLCDRHFGAGADGVLVLTTPAGVDARMQIFNADGGEAEMCGNGLRCLVTYLDQKLEKKKDLYLIQTMNAHYEVIREGQTFKLAMNEISEAGKYDLSSFNQFENVFFINTGVPHLVFLVKDAKEIDIKSVAPKYRYHEIFPKGTNVSFVEVLPEQQTAYVRTYERGVEDETHSCGTGLTACGLALRHWFNWQGKIALKTLGGNQQVEIADQIYYSGEVTFCFEGEFPL